MASHPTLPKRTIEQIVKEVSEIPTTSFPLWTTNDVRFLVDTVKEQQAAMQACAEKVEILRRYIKDKGMS